MADEEKKRRHARSQALSNFTRSANVLDSLITESSPVELVKPQFEKVSSCWERLEAAQEVFIENTEIEVDTDANGIAYLDVPGVKHAQIMKNYSTYLKGVKVAQGVEMEKAASDRRLVEEEKAKADALDRKTAQ